MIFRSEDSNRAAEKPSTADELDPARERQGSANN